MMKEMNHRFGFYLISVLMVVMLLIIYLDIQRLSADVDAFLESSNNSVEFESARLLQPATDLNVDDGLNADTADLADLDAAGDAIVEDDVTLNEEPTQL